MDKELKLKNGGRMTIKDSAEKAELYFYGDIVGSSWDAWALEDVAPIDVVEFFRGLDDNKPVDVYINSGGGDVFGGIAIYNIISRHKGHTTCHIDGLAASIASIIALACDEVYMSEGSQFMIHRPWTFAVGNAEDLMKTVEALGKAEESILNIYNLHAVEGVTENMIKSMMDDETWFTASEVGDYFEIKNEGGVAMAAAMSDYYKHYRQQPEKVVEDKKEPEQIPEPENKTNFELMQAELELLGL